MAAAEAEPAADQEEAWRVDPLADPVADPLEAQPVDPPEERREEPAVARSTRVRRCRRLPGTR